MKALIMFRIAAVAAIVIPISHANGAPVTWDKAKSISNDNDVDKSAATVMAFTACGNNLTVNGVPFTGGLTCVEPPDGSQAGYSVTTTQNGVTAHLEGTPYLTQEAYSLNNAPSSVTSSSTAYQNLLKSCFFGNGPSKVSLTLSGLNGDKKYRVRFWYADYRSGFPPFTESISSNSGSDTNIQTFGLSTQTGTIVTGVFTAGSASESFSVDTNIPGFARLNAVQIEEFGVTNKTP